MFINYVTLNWRTSSEFLRLWLQEGSARERAPVIHLTSTLREEGIITRLSLVSIYH